MSATRRNLLIGIVGLGLGIIFIPSYLKRMERESQAAVLLVEGEKLLEEAANNYKKAGDLRVKAIQKGEQSLSLFPENPAPHLLLGRAFLGQGNHVAASDHFAIYLEKTQGDAEAYREAGIAFEGRWLLSRDSNHRVEAVKYLEACLSQNPQDPAALYHLGFIHHEDKDFSKRDEIWERLLKAAPDSREASLAREKRGG